MCAAARQTIRADRRARESEPGVAPAMPALSTHEVALGQPVTPSAACRGAVRACPISSQGPMRIYDQPRFWTPIAVLTCSLALVSACSSDDDDNAKAPAGAGGTKAAAGGTKSTG